MTIDMRCESMHPRVRTSAEYSPALKNTSPIETLRITPLGNNCAQGHTDRVLPLEHAAQIFDRLDVPPRHLNRSHSKFQFVPLVTM